jgi:adenosine deaminase
MTLEELLRALPKVELHCHLYGAVRKETFSDLVVRRKAPLTPAQIDVLYTRKRKPWPTNDVLRMLDEHLIRKDDDLHRIVLEYLEDASRECVRHAEFFWNPTATVMSGLPYEEAQRGIVCAIRDAATRFNIAGRLIPAIDRERGAEAALEMVQWVIRHREPEVLGIGIDFNEEGNPPELFAEAYRRARDAGLRVTAHAGENGTPWKNVETVIDVLGVSRVDHGYTVIDDPALAARCAERGIVFTVVPTNSFYLRTLPDDRWAIDHPIRKMPAMGLRIHPNTDNPTLHKVTPTQAWMMMVRDFGFGLDDVRSFMHNGLDAAWIDDGQRSAWRDAWTREFDSLRARFEG